jgi:hypothetical protein
MISVETIPGMRGGGIRESGGGGEFKYDMFDTFKNLCKSQDVLPPGNTHTKRLATG